MSRPRIYPEGGRGQLQVRLPVALLDELSAIADERMVARSLLVERALTAYLSHLVPIEELDDLR